MNVIKSENFSNYKNENTAVAIGAFDGLHIGHQAIIHRMLKRAKENSLKSGVFSFEPHPLEIVAPSKAPSYLLSRKQKLNILEDMGVDYFFEQEFTEKFSKYYFEDFVKKILIDKLKIKSITVGSDFKFGKNQNGNVDNLKNLKDKYNISIEAVNVLKKEENKISSTYIRKLIREGKVDKVDEHLGRNYELEGIVVKGEGRGRKLGIPTANLKLSTNYVLPPKGVYAAYVNYKNNKYKAAVNFGINPTFAKEKYTIEAHLLNLNKNLYGEFISIELVQFIRGEMKFNNENDLISQIKEDILYTKEILC